MVPLSMYALVAAALSRACSALVVSNRINISTSSDIAANVSEGSSEDQKLKLKSLESGKHCVGGWNAINPSFSFVPGSSDVAVAFRGLCLSPKVKGHATWHSKLVVGVVPASAIRDDDRTSLPWKSFEIAPDLRYHSSASMVECSLPGADPATGPEDPRFIETPEGLYAIVTGYDLVHSTHPHASPSCGKHGMLLHAAKVRSLSPPRFAAPVKLTFPGMGKIEKNWAMFSPSHAEGSTVHAIYSIHPHHIMEVNLHSGSTNFIDQSESDAVKQLAKKLGVEPTDFHGGAGVTRVKNGGEDYYLSIMHVAKHFPGGFREYWNFPYKFSTTSPYKILHIGKRIPLVLTKNPAYGAKIAFVTTMLYDEGHVLIGYGSGDKESRTFRMCLHDFNEKFFPSSLVESGTDIAEELDSEDAQLIEGRTLFEYADVGSLNTTACSSPVSAYCDGDLSPSICRSTC